MAYIFVLTLNEPKSCTTHVRNASRPTDAVTFAIGKLNLGSAESISKGI